MLLAALLACSTPPTPVERAAWNRAALELDLPLVWLEDAKNPGFADPGEVFPYWRTGGTVPDLKTADAAIREVLANGHPTPPDASEAARRAAVRVELGAGRLTAITTDVAPAEQALFDHLVAASVAIEELYALQRGMVGMDAGIPADDPSSRALFWRNQGPWCATPQGAAVAGCSALPGAPPPATGVYPKEIQSAGFCATLTEEMLDPFTVVMMGPNGVLRTVPFHEAWAEPSARIAKELRAAKAALGPDEPVFAAYLEASAKAFGDGSWFDADVAWAAMNASNSKYYLRIGPDETYFDPCNQKAGYHVSFARNDPQSLDWQTRLRPRVQAMEDHIAALAGPPYAARPADFQLPDFIEIVLNAGDDRSPILATVGQSLPNWGPVSETGRTVVMSNIGKDPDSLAAARDTVASVACADSVARLGSAEPADGDLFTVLHEATHNLGPHGGWLVDGKADDEQFGGSLAQMMEELHAQTGALVLAKMLADSGDIPTETLERGRYGEIVWMMGSASRGMTDPEGRIDPYAQLGIIQIGRLIDGGALAWRADELAANGTDKGCLAVTPDKLDAAVEALAKDVFGIKARGDKKAALALQRRYTEGPELAPLRAALTERWGRMPASTFVYVLRPGRGILTP